MEIILTITFWIFIFWMCWKWFLRGWVSKHSATRAMQAQFVARQIPDEAYFEMAGEEVARGIIRKGLWVKAMARALGDDKKASAIYIRLRVLAMRQEAAAAIRQASDREFVAKDFAHDTEPVSQQKIVLSCPKCAGRLRVASNKLLDITCPHCQAKFRAQT